jgi:hypothetical protein
MKRGPSSLLCEAGNKTRTHLVALRSEPYIHRFYHKAGLDPALIEGFSQCLPAMIFNRTRELWQRLPRCRVLGRGLAPEMYQRLELN